MRHPLLRIDHFPALIKVARSGGDVRMFFRHALPRACIAVPKGEILRVRPVAQDYRKLSIFHRAKDIGAQDQPIIHYDRHVPIDPHAVTDFSALLQRCHYALPKHRTCHVPRKRGIQYLQSWGLSKATREFGTACCAIDKNLDDTRKAAQQAKNNLDTAYNNFNDAAKKLRNMSPSVPRDLRRL